jgi:hypothetical protein
LVSSPVLYVDMSGGVGLAFPHNGVCSRKGEFLL